jgi:PmbA protein
MMGDADMGGPGIMGRDEALTLLESALAGSPADATELVYEGGRTEVTRFANSRIHQNVSQLNTRVAVRVAVGQASVRVFTNSLAEADLRRAISDATSLARMQTPNPRFGGLPEPEPEDTSLQKPPSYFESTARMGPAEREATVGGLIDSARAAELEAFGTYQTTAAELAVASSTGIRAYAPYTVAYLKLLVDRGGNTGFADALGRDAATLDPVRVAQDAIAKCLANREQGEIAPGEYEAVFDPNAVADMLRFPTVWGMGARAFLDGQSFMSGKVGERVTGEQISIWDDPNDPRCMPMPIDYEGVPSRRVDIVREGVALGPVYDAQTAHEAGVRSTGHASTVFTDYPERPTADHILMPTGTATPQELVSRVRNGVWVTRFHYTHCPDGKRVIATGTTRDGTYLIRDGEVVGALRNLRLEMSVLDLLASLQEAGAGKLCQDWWSMNGMSTNNFYAPAMRFGAARFTGVTTF